MDEHGYFVNTPWTWRERLRYRLFPNLHCDLPPAPATHLDCLHVTTVVHLSVIDRLRVLASGKLTVQTRTVTENIVGNAVTSSVAYPSL